MIFIQAEERDLFNITGLSDAGCNALVRTFAKFDQVKGHIGAKVFTKVTGAGPGFWEYFRGKERIVIPGIPTDGSVEQAMTRAAVWGRMDLGMVRLRHTMMLTLGMPSIPWTSGSRLASWQLAVALSGRAHVDGETLRALAAWAEVDRHEAVIERTTGIPNAANPLAELRLTGRMSYAAARLRGKDLGVTIDVPKIDPPSPWSMTTAMMLTPRLMGAMT